MERNNLTTKAFKSEVYAEFGDDYIRTMPTYGLYSPYLAFFNIHGGETRVPFDNKLIHEVLSSGEEITKKDYDKAVFTAVNRI